jgi:exo-1,4-beta-D-glucosaminidase
MANEKRRGSTMIDGRRFWITTIVWVAGFALAAHSETWEQPIAEGWRLQSSAELKKPDGAALSTPGVKTDDWYPVTIPTTVLAALVENEVYPDPYFGENLKTIPGYQPGRWMRMEESSPFYPSWWYRTEFTVPAESPGKQIRLHLDGINYRANVWLNGVKVAGDDTVKGMFQRFELDVTEVIKPGEPNALAIEVFAPGKLPEGAYRTKQVEATTGWDDHNPQPPDLNMGIWRDVHLTACGPIMLRHPFVQSDLSLPELDRAELTVEVQVTNLTDARVIAEVSGTIEEIAFTETVELAPNEARWIHITPAQCPELLVQNPRLWWPNPLGPQNLYDMDVQAHVDGVLSDSTGTRFGIRHATTYINDEGWRGYRINGKDVLIRGGAWMTNEMLLRFSEQRDRALVRYAREANLNMLRSEGFSIRETDQFYDICDELGVMVTQQLFGRSIPDEDLAIDCIRDSVLRIRNHPSLVHFLGHDETFPTDRLDEAYQGIIAKYSPGRTYQPHSGAFDVKDRFDTGGTRTGTRELWTYADPTRHYNSAYEEYARGFAQSGGIGGIVSQIESVRRMIPEDQLWPIWTDAMSFHTVIQEGDFFQETVKALNTRYGTPKDIDDFCMTAQVMNYESARAMYEAYARNKYDATGITTWKYNAAWPAVMTWHYVDYYLLPTGAYYGAKKACEELHVQYSYDDRSVWVVNSLYQGYDGLKVTARIFNLDMSELYTESAAVNVGSDGKTSAFVVGEPEGLSTTYFLVLTLENAAGERVSENVYWLSTVPDIPGEMKDGWLDFQINAKSVADLTALRSLPDVTVTAAMNTSQHGDETVAEVTVENPTDRLAFFINLGIMKGEDGFEVAPCYWEENDFSLLPGEKRTISATFSSEDLEGAKPILRVDGWNVTSAE